MDIKELLEKHPDLYNQVKSEGVIAERKRIKALDQLRTASINNKENLAIIDKAKFETFETSENIVTTLYENLAKGTQSAAPAQGAEQANGVVNFEQIKNIVNKETNVGETNPGEIDNTKDLIEEIVNLGEEL